MAKKTFVFNCEWQEVLVDYPAEVRLEVYDALIEYIASGTLLELKPMAKIAFSFIKKEVDYNNQKYNDIINKRSEAGQKGNEVRWGKKYRKCDTCDTPIANIAVNDNDNDNVIKEKINKKENFDFFKSLLAIGVSEQVASDWLKVRKTKKATNTKTAFDRILTEINNSNQSADYCIRIAVEKNWQGFRAEWLNNLTNQKNGTITNARDKGIISHPAEGEDDEITTFGI